MKKVLFTATVVKKHIMEFHIPYLRWFKEHGYETFVAAKNDYDNKEECNIPYCDHYIDIEYARNPLSKKNIDSYKKIKNILKENNFDIIHCHTPVASVLVRLANHSLKNPATMIYTAHGFHFFKGAPLLNWLIYYPVEKFCARYTDQLITINNEDYKLACDKKFKAKKIDLVHGVGITFDYRNVERGFERSECNIDDNAFLLVSVGEINKNKNHRIVMEALNDKRLKDKNIHYVIAGQGDMMEDHKKYLSDNNLNNVHLLGYRKDIYDILKKSDTFVFPSLREGLPISLIEAMNCGLPCVVSDVRGSRDLITHAKGGYICHDKNEYVEAILALYNDKVLCKDMGNYNVEMSKEYLLENVIKEYEGIYKRYI